MYLIIRFFSIPLIYTSTHQVSVFSSLDTKKPLVRRRRARCSNDKHCSAERTWQILRVQQKTTAFLVAPNLGNKGTIKMVILLMAEILHQLIGSLPHYLQGFIHPRWCRISAINCITSYLLKLGVFFGGPKKILSHTQPPHEFYSGFFWQIRSDSGYSSSQGCPQSENYTREN